MRAAMAVAGLGLASAGVAGYWAYTLLGVDALGPAMLRPRRWVVGTGAALAGLSMVGAPRVSVAVPAALTGALTAYAVRNQWLIPRPAPTLRPSERDFGPDEWMAVLDGQGAVPLRWAARLRTARVGRTLVVHCGLARSLTAFEAPEEPVAAVLPHATGFDIATASRRWDGVDGSARDGGPDLRRVPVRLTRRQGLQGPILAPPGDPEPPARHRRRPRIPGARGVTEPLTWGAVHGHRWTPLTGDEPADFYLGRWAALRRGLC